MPRSIRGLYAVADTHALAEAHLIPSVGAAIAGGARIVQYRDKTTDATRRERQAHALASMCRAAGVLFLINDDAVLAAAVGADGVHLGRDDGPVLRARALLGERAIVGVSCYNDPQRATEAQAQRADYVAFGSFFSSATKPGATRASPDTLRAVRAQLTLPIVAIGGITPENGGELIAAGADALAAVQGLFGAADIQAQATRYARLFDPARAVSFSAS